MKYIDAEKLKEIIDKTWRELSDKNAKVGGDILDAEIYTYLSVLNLIDSLQQEQSEVDLEKVIDGLTAGWIEGEEYGELQNINTCRCVTLGEVKEAMRCMFELGIKAAQKGE